MLGDIKPEAIISKMSTVKCRRLQSRFLLGFHSPEVQVVDTALIVAHVDVKGVQIHRRKSASREHLEQRRQTVARALVGRRRAQIHAAQQTRRW